MEPEIETPPTPAVESEPTVETEPEAPDSFEPFERWKAKWEPFADYLTLAQVQEEIGDRDLAEILSQCQCVGHTMHKEVELPSSVWKDTHWQWDVAENRCGQPRFSDHLQFQVQVYALDVAAALRDEDEDEESEESSSEPTEGGVNVEVVVGFQGLPDGWGMRTLEGLGWQAYVEDEVMRVYGPMRAQQALAVGDAWSFKASGDWA